MDTLEKELVSEYLSAFEPDWIIVREVTGTHQITGKSRRIDAIVKAKDYDNIIFGIEFKSESLDSFTKFTHWFKQSVTYTQCIWNLKTKRKVCILIAPDFHYQNKEVSFLAKRLLGEFGIGFIQKSYYKHLETWEYSIVIKDVKIWSSITGFNKIAIKQDFNKYL